jgi:hypothetical protein
MPQEDGILRKSLDAVDRHKWQTISVVSFAIIFAPIELAARRER